MTDATPGTSHDSSSGGLVESPATPVAPEIARAAEPPAANPYAPAIGASSSVPGQYAAPAGWAQQAQPQIHNQQVQYPTPAQPMYAASTPLQPPRGRSIASMWIGIASLIFGIMIVLPIVGLVLGIAGWKAEPAGKGAAIAGVILNSLVLLFWALIAALAIVGYLAFGIAGGFLL